VDDVSIGFFRAPNSLLTIIRSLLILNGRIMSSSASLILDWSATLAL
jgi:hypothetical protein